MPPIEPPDDEVSITDLDMDNKERGKFAHFVQRSLLFFLQAKRKILTIATIGIATLFLFVVLLPLLPKPAVPSKVQRLTITLRSASILSSLAKARIQRSNGSQISLIPWENRTRWWRQMTLLSGRNFQRVKWF